MEINLEDKFEEMIDEFDFDKVKKVMEFIEWKWSGGEDEGYPARHQMKKHCRELFYNSFESRESNENWSDWGCSSGGFKVTIYKNNDIALEFILEDKEYEAEGNFVY